MPVTHYIRDYRGVVAGAPCLDVLRELKTEIERRSHHRPYPQMRMFLQRGYATQPSRFHSECRELEQNYEEPAIKQTLSYLAKAAEHCSEIMILTASA